MRYLRLIGSLAIYLSLYLSNLVTAGEVPVLCPTSRPDAESRQRS
jgi:hypothetical protein